MCNKSRIEVARAAWSRGDAPYYGEEAITDLLADLRHFCAATGIEFTSCDRLAEVHYEIENGGAS